MNEFSIASLAGLDAIQIAQKFASDPALAKAVVAEAAKPYEATAKGSRAELLARFSQLEAGIQAGLKAGTLQSVETAYYFLRSASGLTNVHMIQSGDKKTPGITNVDFGKVDITQPFLLSGIMLLSGVAGGTAEADGKACDFGLIDKYLRNGEFKFIANGDKLVIPPCSTEVFVTHRITNNTIDADGVGVGTTVTGTAVAMGENAKVGLYKLDNPKLIMSQAALAFDLEWGTALVSNTWIKLVLLGSRVFAR